MGMKKIFSTDNEIEVAFIVSLLRHNKIESKVKPRGTRNYFVKKGLKQELMKDIYVQNYDYDAAQRIINEHAVTLTKDDSIQDKIIVFSSIAIIILIIFFSVYNTVIN